MVFEVINFLQKTNVQLRFYYLVELFLFVFWRKSATPKNLFKINWPLVTLYKWTIAIFQSIFFTKNKNKEGLLTNYVDKIDHLPLFIYIFYLIKIDIFD